MKLTDAESMKILINKSLTVPLSKDRISLFFKNLCKQKNEFVSFHIYTARRKTSLFFVVPTNTFSYQTQKCQDQSSPPKRHLVND